jgi:hypothetical protein
LTDGEFYTVEAFDNFVKAAPRRSQFTAANGAGSSYGSPGGDELHTEFPNPYQSGELEIWL